MQSAEELLALRTALPSPAPSSTSWIYIRKLVFNQHIYDETINNHWIKHHAFFGILIDSFGLHCILCKVCNVCIYLEFYFYLFS